MSKMTYHYLNNPYRHYWRSYLKCFFWGLGFGMGAVVAYWLISNWFYW